MTYAIVRDSGFEGGHTMTDLSPRLRTDDLILAVLCTVTGPTLWWFGSYWAQSGPTLSAVHQLELGLASALAVIGAGITLYWAVAVFGTLVALLGARLRIPRMMRAGMKVSPAFLRRIAAGILGVQLLVAPGAWAAPSSDDFVPDDAARSIELVQSQSVPRPHFTTTHGDDLPSPGWRPQTPHPQPPGTPLRSTDDSSTITVRHGDCLWDIAAEELGPYATDIEIDTRWRDWHRVNQHIIGADPHHLIPGTVLTAPTWD